MQYVTIILRSTTVEYGPLECGVLSTGRTFLLSMGIGNRFAATTATTTTTIRCTLHTGTDRGYRWQC